jgi:SPP1 family predicted phage head-tail adaptor
MYNKAISSILSHRIIFLENKTSSELEEQDWQEIYASFAEIKPMYDNKFGSIETFTFGHIVTEAFFMFKIRFTKIVNAKMHISFSGRIFEIKRIINVAEKNQILQIIALEI